MQGVILFSGAITTVVALSEAHLRISRRVGWVLLALCVVYRLLRGSEGGTATSNLKLYLALFAIPCLFGGYTRIFTILLFINVLVCAVPPLLRGNAPLILLVLWLALLTPTRLDGWAGTMYSWSYFAVLFTYSILSEVTRAYRVQMLVGILPMAMGLLLHKAAHAGTAGAVYRTIGMLVSFMFPDAWHICTSLTASHFRRHTDGTQCTPGSFADRLDRLQTYRSIRCILYVTCALLLALSSAEAARQVPQ